MSQSPVLYTLPSTAKRPTNTNGYRSRVRETARKFENLEKSNASPPSPALSHHSTVAIQINSNNNNTAEKNGASPSGSSSSSDSIADELIAAEKTSPSSPSERVLLTKPHISTARIEIRPPSQHRPTPHIQRTVPSILREDEEPTYVNHGDDFDEQKLVNGHDLVREDDDENEIDEVSHVKPTVIRKMSYSSKYSRNGFERTHRYKNSDADSIELTPRFQRKLTVENEHFDNRRGSSFNLNHETHVPPQRARTLSVPSHHLPSSSLPPAPPPPPPTSVRPFAKHSQQTNLDDFQIDTHKRSFPLSNFMVELGALLVVFLVSMTLALAVRQDETRLRTTMQVVFSYIYLFSITWMIWCSFDIIKFRREWAGLIENAGDQEDYMDISERHSNKMFYFPDIHNTGGLFMRVGAGIFCMGSLVLTVLGIAINVVKLGSDEVKSRAASSLGLSTPATLISQLITYILRFLFHCIQYSFIFRYGNLVINRYCSLAKIGLIHLVIANFCTWFEAIVIETLEQLHKNPSTPTSTTDPMNTTTTTTTSTTVNDSISVEIIKVLAAAADADTSTGNNRTTLEILHSLESSLAVYLYPCLIEYSLIALTVFFIMWNNVGKDDKRSNLRFGDRHVFTVNCARASGGLLIGGIVLLLTLVTLIPTYIFEEYTTTITQLTAFVLLIVSLLIVCLSYFHTTKLFYDRHAHVDVFDQVLILITTFGDFAYALFGIYASIFVMQSQNKLPVGIEIASGFLAIFQTFLQSNFILDALKRRITTRQEHRKKPGRETITALLLLNLALWIHDSISAKKVRLNPSQMTYYNANTWAIIQAFSSPLSIFYRFHSSVCLADIWQEVYHYDDARSERKKSSMIPLVEMNGGHEN